MRKPSTDEAMITQPTAGITRRLLGERTRLRCALAVFGAALLLSWAGAAAAQQPACRDIRGNFTQPLGSKFYGQDGTTYMCVQTSTGAEWVALPARPGPAATSTPNPTATPEPATPTPATPTPTSTPIPAPPSPSGGGGVGPLPFVLGGIGLVGVAGAVYSADTVRRTARARQGRFASRDGWGAYDLEEDLGLRRYWPGPVRVPLDAVLEELGEGAAGLQSNLLLNGGVVLEVAAEDGGRLILDGRELEAGHVVLYRGARLAVDGSKEIRYEVDDDDGS